MLLEFGLKNYCSFKEQSIISFRKPEAYSEQLDSDLPALNILGIKGANASGKTSILKALTLLKLIVLHSKSKEELILAKTFFNNSRPVELYCELYLNDIYYKYEIHFNSEKIIHESLSRKNKRWTTLFVRSEHGIQDVIEQYSILKDISFQLNSSVLSTLRKMKYFDNLPGFPEICNWFDWSLTNLNVVEGVISNILDYKQASLFYNTNKVLFDSVKSIICQCDLGISNIVIKSDIDEAGNKFYYPVFIHSYKKSNYEIAYHEESQGVKQLYIMLSLYHIIIEQNGCAIIDEFDVHLHPNLIPKITKLFEDARANNKPTQLVFTTHDTDVLDLLGKHRTVLVNKEDNESYCYRLDEISSVRSDRSIIPLYKKGVIGGVPTL